jgi:hypothetical protein
MPDLEAVPGVGALRPFEELRTSIERWYQDDRQRRPEGDPTVHALDQFRQQLDQAIEASRTTVPELDVKQIAALEGVTVSAIHKRHQRGKLPQATRRGRRLVVPAPAGREGGAR